MTIFEIDDAILECIDQETGDIIDIERLESLEMARNEKISNIACWIKELKAEAEAIKAEKQNLEKRQKAAENKAEQLKNYLKMALNGEKYKDARVSISYRKSESVEIAEDINIDSLPDEFVKVTKLPVLTAIKDAIKSGQDIEGCKIIEKESIQIR